ncbi:MAG: hypothetical protein ACK5PF_05565, partial [bacterium]
YLPIERLGANLFFQLISRRYERGPYLTDRIGPIRKCWPHRAPTARLRSEMAAVHVQRCTPAQCAPDVSQPAAASTIVRSRSLLEGAPQVDI